MVFKSTLSRSSIEEPYILHKKCIILWNTCSNSALVFLAMCWSPGNWQNLQVLSPYMSVMCELVKVEFSGVFFTVGWFVLLSKQGLIPSNIEGATLPLNGQAHIAACLSWRLVLDCKQLLQDKYVVYGITTLHGTLCVDMTVWKWYHTIGAGLISAHKTCKVNSTVAIEISPQIEDNSDRFSFFFLVSKRIYSLCLRMCYGCIFIQCPVILFSMCQSYIYMEFN